MIIENSQVEEEEIRKLFANNWPTPQEIYLRKSSYMQTKTTFQMKD